MVVKFKALKRNTTQQKGVALLAALILIMAVVLTLGSIFYRHQIDVSRLSKMLHSDQALLMALSVESWASQLLSEGQDDLSVDSLDENWSLAVPILPIDGGFIRGCIVDLESKININNFASYDLKDWSDQVAGDSNGLAASWLSLLNSLSLPANESLIVSIIDWTDENTTPFNDLSAEQYNYDIARTTVVVPNAPLNEINELSVLRGYNLNIVQQLKPYISVLPRETTININTASKKVLLAISSSYTQGFSDFIVDARPFSNIENFHLELSNYLGLTPYETKALWPEDLIGITSNYFQLNLQVTLGEATIEIHSIMDRYNRAEAVIIRRTVSVIPTILPDSIETADIGSPEPAFCENTGLTRS